MAYIAWSIILLILVTGVVIFFSRQKVARDTKREKEMTDPTTANAYDEMSKGRLFRLMRFIIEREVKNFRASGILMDIGCGPGYVTRELATLFPDTQVMGVDVSSEMLKLAAVNTDGIKRIDLSQADVERLPFRNNSVDFVISTGSLHHWKDPVMAFIEIHRILKPGGEFILLDLRRDVPRVVYYATYLAERFTMPDGITASCGATGSIRASFTPGELANLAKQAPFYNWIVRPRFGWFSLWAQKDSQTGSKKPTGKTGSSGYGTHR